jgi:rhamnosyltransferase
MGGAALPGTISSFQSTMAHGGSANEGPSEDASRGLAAGIVAFDPEPTNLKALVGTVAPQVDRIFIFVNGSIEKELSEELAAAFPALSLIEAPVNFGVGTALNIVALAASLAGSRRLILFDQDSAPGPGLIPGLAAGFDRLASTAEPVAVVGPRLAAPAGGARFKSPRYGRNPSRTSVDALTPVRFLATSGSLIDLDAFRAVGKFRDDYFIDAVDLEWCFRAWSKGFSCWVVQDVAMVHTIGAGTIRALGVETPRQKPFRMETYLRNNVYGWRLPHVPLAWKLRQAFYLPVQALLFWKASGWDRSTLKSLVRGVAHGARGRLGPPPGAPLTEP